MSQSFVQSSRRPNWEIFQINTLTESVTENIAIVNANHSEANTEQKKKLVWLEISKRVSSVGHERTAEECKKKWSDYTSRLKHKISKNRHSMCKTGGGPSDQLVLTAAEEQVLGCIPSESIKGIDGAMDSADNDCSSSGIMTTPKRSRKCNTNKDHP